MTPKSNSFNTSWSSVEEDETTYDWTHEHIAVLTAVRLAYLASPVVSY